MDDSLDIVRGRRIERMSGDTFRAWARSFKKMIVEVGTGDGRWLYRQARAHPRWACVGVDANTDRMREVSFRAGRKPSRGGIQNVLFVRASVEGLPQALHGSADEIYILYPWGSLLDGVWTPRAEALSAIATLARPGGRLEVHLNASAIMNRRPDLAAMASRYAAGGIRLDEMGPAESHRTSWAMRLAQGGDMRAIVLRGTVGR